MPLTNPNIKTICEACPKNVTLRSICEMLIPTINPSIVIIYMWLDRKVVTLWDGWGAKDAEADQLVCDDVETNKKSTHKDNMYGLPKKLSHFEMDGDVKSTRHRSISQDRGYNFNLIWVWFTGLHTPSFLRWSKYIWKKYWSWLENLQKVPIKKSKTFLLCGGDGL